MAPAAVGLTVVLVGAALAPGFYMRRCTPTTAAMTSMATRPPCALGWTWWPMR
ncbi:hypothetical protein [Xylophilus sp. ASV27]|uniref:hypothetical protein n=1 Tax=Xylophilus sp. ASV27 TaxID=2795129 RepID=UPI001E5FA4AB|nr:hypothetical protein [Xylophilus sp. ASV27]